MNRWSIVIEKKTFTVGCSKDDVEIGEKSRSLHVSVSIEVSLVRWMGSKLKSWLKGDKWLGFLGSRKGSNFSGWNAFLNALDWMMNINPGVPSAVYRRMLTNDKVEAESVSHTTV